MSRTSARLVAGLFVVLAGCVGNPAPARWLPTPIDAPTDVHGAWLEATVDRVEPVRGELLAVGADTVYVLRLDGTVLRVEKSRITRARVARYDSQYGQTAGWAALGALGTLSHGFVLILSLPIWIITGSASAAADSRAPITDPLRKNWESVAAYARFPAGLPPLLPERLSPKR